MATEQDPEHTIVRVPTGAWAVDPTHSSVEVGVEHSMISSEHVAGDEVWIVADSSAVCTSPDAEVAAA